ncbi:MAG: amidohydrolase family protein [Brevinematales bacterium]|nr:amidohydrolase family protein [Brevinematales bacterium]
MIVFLKPGMIITPEEILEDKGIYIDITNGRIIEISDYTLRADINIILTKDTIAIPGIINAHDHLLGSYWPRVGEGPHISWKPWDDILKSSDVYKERSKIPNFYLYLIGAYKNLLSGVTTVMDHIPHKVNDNFIDKLPVKVIKEYCLAHEVSSYDLKWGDGIEIEHKRAVERNWPFVTHIEEGFDEESTKGIDYLVEYRALTEHTVMVHGLALSDYDLDRIAEAGAHLVTCPISNYFMFKLIARLKEWLNREINTSLGTDSPMSGGINILEEMKFLKYAYKNKYNEDLDDKTILYMITKNPAKAFRIDQNVGYIKKGYLADMTIFRRKTSNLFADIINAWFNDIEIVFINGIPRYGYDYYEDVFKKFSNKIPYSKVIIDGKSRIIVGSLEELIRNIWEFVGFKKQLPFIPITIEDDYGKSNSSGNYISDHTPSNISLRFLY